MRRHFRKANLAIGIILVSALFGGIRSEASDGVIKFLNHSSASSGDVVLLNGFGAEGGLERRDHGYPYDLYNGEDVVDLYCETDFPIYDDMLMQEGHADGSMLSFYGVMTARMLPDPNVLTEIETSFLQYPDRYTVDKVKAIWDVYERQLNTDVDTMEEQPYIYVPYGSWDVKALAFSKYRVPFVVEHTIGTARTDYHYPHYRWEVRFQDGNGWAGADTNLDDYVDFYDFANLSAWYGTDCSILPEKTFDCYECFRADTDDDGVVGFADVVNTALHWLSPTEQ